MLRRRDIRQANRVELTSVIFMPSSFGERKGRSPCAFRSRGPLRAELPHDQGEAQTHGTGAPVMRAGINLYRR